MHLIHSLMETQQLESHISSEKLNGQRVHVLSGPNKIVIITKHDHHFDISIRFESRQIKTTLDLNLNVVSLDSGKWSLSDEDVILKKDLELRFTQMLPRALGSQL